MAIHFHHDFHGVARVEIGPESKLNCEQPLGPGRFSYRTIRLYPADDSEPTEIKVFGDFSGILVTEEPQP